MFSAHDYMETYGMRPPSFLELFEFLRRKKVNSILHDMAIAAAKAGRKDG